MAEMSACSGRVQGKHMSFVIGTPQQGLPRGSTPRPSVASLHEENRLDFRLNRVVQQLIQDDAGWVVRLPGARSIVERDQETHGRAWWRPGIDGV